MTPTAVPPGHRTVRVASQRPTDAATALVAQWRLLADTVQGCSAAEWDASTRCPPWLVRDIAGRAVGLGQDSLAGDPFARTPVEQAASFRNGAPAAVAATLRSQADVFERRLATVPDDGWMQPVAPELPLLDGVVNLAYDAYVYTDDILDATGRPSAAGPALPWAVSRLARALAERGWGPATLNLDGAAPTDVGVGGRTVTGDAHMFVLAAAGRVSADEAGFDGDINVYG